MSQPVGTFCLVLHSHLPWLAHHGAWPVGEEWLYQSWSTSYLRVVDVLERLAERGQREVLTLGITPVLAAQLDDPHCLHEEETWLGFWQARALALASDPRWREDGAREHRAAAAAHALFDRRWRAGGSAVIRALAEAGVIEVLGGPATHPYAPLLDDRVAAFALATGLDDARWRRGAAPAGIWAPECGYRPGLEAIYAQAGVTHVVVDGPTLQHVGAPTWAPRAIGSSSVVAFARDLETTYRVWSPRKGYPGGAWYRDFHSVDAESGFRHWRVTSRSAQAKAPYDPERAAAAALADAHDFVARVRGRLVDIAAQRGRPGLTVAAYDTELFGHWWHEGPLWLEHVLRLLPEAGVRVGTLAGSLDLCDGPIELEEGSWGTGKDSRVWAGPQVERMVEDNAILQARLLDLADKAPRTIIPDAARDQAARSALLALSSDWAFMVTKDSAAGYAIDRHRAHHADFHQLARLIESGSAGALPEAARQGLADGPFPHLDARLLARA